MTVLLYEEFREIANKAYVLDDDLVSLPTGWKSVEENSPLSRQSILAAAGLDEETLSNLSMDFDIVTNGDVFVCVYSGTTPTEIEDLKADFALAANITSPHQHVAKAIGACLSG